MLITLSGISLAWLGAAAWLDRHGLKEPPAGDFDAIVVLGCRVAPGGRPSVSLARRAERAAALWLEGRAPRVVTTGGVGDHPPSEARAAADVAIARGVDPSAILLEERSTTTRENAREARALLESEGVDARRVLVVSDSYHCFRARRIFRRHFETVASAGSEGPTRARTRGALREVAALAAHATRLTR
ncbi:MAG: YdcF family protein [Myxococcota bacterium]|nr:YdcF family protein [Myxococcota bacterium]